MAHGSPLDLLRRDSVPVDGHLPVDPPDDADAAVVAAPAEVAGAVRAEPRYLERVRYKPGVGAGAGEVTGGEVRAADHDLAVRVGQEQLGAAHPGADADRRVIR